MCPPSKQCHRRPVGILPSRPSLSFPTERHPTPLYGPSLSHLNRRLRVLQTYVSLPEVSKGPDTVFYSCGSGRFFKTDARVIVLQDLLRWTLDFRSSLLHPVLTCLPKSRRLLRGGRVTATFVHFVLLGSLFTP